MTTLAKVILALSVTLTLPLNADIYKSANCFRADLPDYQAFLGFLTQKNPGKAEMVAKRTNKLIGQENYDKAKSNLNCYFMSYENDGLTIPGYLVEPKNMKDKKFPVVVYNRGGNANYGAIIFYRLFNMIFPLAQGDYIVVASQYRGMNPNKPEEYGNDEFGGRDVSDVHKLIDLVKQHPNADPENIFLVGASRGAIMNYLVAKQRNDIRAMVSLAGPTDLLKGLEWRPEMEKVFQERIPNYEENKESELKKRSVIYWPEQLPEETPILLLHGEQDKRVNVKDSIKFSKKLDELERANKLVVYEDENHFFSKNKGNLMKEIFSWLKTNLKR